MKNRTTAMFAFASALIALPAFAAPASYTIDPSHTSVTAESRHFGTTTVRSRFAAKSGTVTIDPAEKTGSVTMDFDIASVVTGVPKLNAHLKSTDFFDANSYPDATFTGKQITFDGDKVVSMTGDLTMKGKTAPITLTATNYNCYMSPMAKKQVCGGSFETTIQRSVWDVRYLIPFVSDETRLKVEIEAIKD